jgi:hypothetical protein
MHPCRHEGPRPPSETLHGPERRPVVLALELELVLKKLDALASLIVEG